MEQEGNIGKTFLTGPQIAEEVAAYYREHAEVMHQDSPLKDRVMIRHADTDRISENGYVAGPERLAEDIYAKLLNNF